MPGVQEREPPNNVADPAAVGGDGGHGGWRSRSNAAAQRGSFMDDCPGQVRMAATSV